jgi:hypothetical protein
MMSKTRSATILRLDAALCAACGLPGLLAPAWLAGFLLPGQESVLGFATATVMWELGILLVAYAGLLLLASAPRGPLAALDRPVLAITAIADAGWVVGTFALIAAFPAGFSAWGMVALTVVALDTALIGLWKLRLLRGHGAPLAV